MVQDAPPRSRGFASGMSWGLVNSLLSRSGQLVLGVVLARLLAPEEFGVFAVALVAFAVVVNVSELGVSVALVRVADTDVARLAPTVTTLTLASGIGLASLCWATAGWSAAAMEAPQAADVLRVLAPAVAIAGAAAVPGSLLQRNFRQDLRTAVDAVAFVVSAAVTLATVLAGAGAVSLAWGRLAAAVVALVGLYAVSAERYRPGWNRSVVPGLLRSGLPLAGASLLVFVLLNVDYVVISKELGTTALGLYLLAFNIASWPVNSLSSAVRAVALPALARRTDAAQRAQAFAVGLRWLLTLSLPICVLLAVFAEDLVSVVYGQRWIGCAAALSLLCLLGAARIVVELAYGLLMAAERGASVLLINAVWLATLTPAAVVGARLDGIRGVGIAHALIVLVVVVPAHVLVLRTLQLRLWVLVRGVSRPIGAAMACGLVAVALRGLDGPRPVVLLLAATAAAGAWLLVALPVLAEMAEARSAGTKRHAELVEAA